MPAYTRWVNERWTALATAGLSHVELAEEVTSPRIEVEESPKSEISHSLIHVAPDSLQIVSYLSSPSTGFPCFLDKIVGSQKLWRVHMNKLELN